MQRIFPKQQSGLVLIILLTIIMVGGLAWLLTGLNRNHYEIAKQTQTIDALVEAKEALLAFAVTYFDQEDSSGKSLAGYYGFLPCPDVNGSLSSEGAQDPSCGGKDNNSLGRLPWRSLGIAPPRDGAGECLWYAVAGPYKNSLRSDLLNEDRAGRFVIREANGTATAPRVLGAASSSVDSQRPVALIIAPNAVLSTSIHPQNRAPDGTAPVCGGNYNPNNYLDTDSYLDFTQTPWVGSDINNAMLGNTNKAGVENAVISSPRNSSVNDIIMYISRAEIFDIIRRRVEFQQNLQCLTQIAAQCLAKYARDNGRLPWPAPVALTNYIDNSAYVDDASVTNLGRLPNSLSNSNTHLSITTPEFLLTNGNDFLCDLSSLDSSTLSQCVTPLTPAELTLCDGQATTMACQDKNERAVTAARRLWQHWKDHLFYAVSSSFAPDSPLTGCTGSCVQINGIEYAGMVLLAGKATTDITVPPTEQHRNMTPDIETMNDLAQYVDIANADGDDAYTHLADAVRTETDDFIICIGADLAATSVVPCP